MPLRDSVLLLNAMLLDLYTGLSSSASSTSLAAAINNVNESLGSLAVTVATKADFTVIALKANSADVPRYDQDQTLSDIQRLQLARNTGALVTLAYPLIGTTLNLVTGSWTLQRMPGTFLIKEAALVLDTCGGGQISADLKTLTTDPIANISNIEIVASAVGRKLVLNITNQTITEMNGLVVRVTQYDRDYLDTGSKGLTLWLRGVWLP